MALVGEFKKDFQRLITENNLAHGYILFGHESAEEKFLFSGELANFLENRKWEKSSKVLLDALILNAQEEGGIDLVRSASQFLWQKPAISSKRTLIINRADDLTLPAQNAILKISEEPPRHALIILIVRDPEVLLPAVVSRFQKIYINGSKSKIQNPNDKTNSQIIKFLKTGTAQKKEIIKNILEEGELQDFVTGLIIELRKDKIKNWQVLKELLHRWSLINQFNVNKRLQLEAALLQL